VSAPRVSLTVHRSAAEIGGNCVELRAGEHRLILDAGQPLDAPLERAALPASLDREAPVEGVLFSHAHQDHWGLIHALPEGWDVWSGPGAAALIQLTRRVRGERQGRALRTWRAWRPFALGPFTITPHLVDHSAPDAYLLQVDVAGRRLLYSGDLRFHGRKARLMRRLMRAPPTEVDALVLEGTNLGSDKPHKTEGVLEDELIGLLVRTPGRAWVSWSAQNLDRTITLFRACRRTGRRLVLDLYTMEVLETLARALGRHGASIPRLGWPEIRVVVTGRLARAYRRWGREEHVQRLARSGFAFSARKLARPNGREVLMIRPSMVDDLAAAGVVPSARDRWLFSLWRGYLERDDWQPLVRWFGAAGTPTLYWHSSGHASPRDLLAFVKAVKPRRMIPIHGERWDSHGAAFPGIVRLRDGASLEL
jgi:ribonuclease J